MLNLAQEKMIDLLKASNQEAFEVVLQDIFPEVAKELSSSVVDEALAGLIGAAVGATLPRVNGIWLNYKQNRFERNVKKMLAQFAEQQSYIIHQMQAQKQEIWNDFKSEYLETLLDAIADEPQLRKVEYNVNGYMHLLATENPNEDMVLMFFKTLAELNELDLRVLRMYAGESDDNYWKILDETGIDDDQYRFIKEKLNRLGMLQSKNEVIREDNLEEVIKYIKEVQKQNKASKPKAVKDPKVKKVSSSDNYYITRLGKQYLDLIKPITE